MKRRYLGLLVLVLSTVTCATHKYDGHVFDSPAAIEVYKREKQVLAPTRKETERKEEAASQLRQQREDARSRLLGAIPADQVLDLTDPKHRLEFLMAYLNDSDAENARLSLRNRWRFPGGQFEAQRELAAWARLRKFKYFLLPAAYLSGDYDFKRKAYPIEISRTLTNDIDARFSEPLFFAIDPASAEKISTRSFDANVKDLTIIVLAELKWTRIETKTTSDCLTFDVCWKGYDKDGRPDYLYDNERHRYNAQCYDAQSRCESEGHPRRPDVRRVIEFKPVHYLIYWDSSPTYKNY